MHSTLSYLSTIPTRMLITTKEPTRQWQQRVSMRLGFATTAQIETHAPETVFFTLQEAEAIYDYEEKKFFLAKGTGTIESWKLSKSEQQAFHDARYKEVKALLDLGAMRILSLEESLAFREKYPEYILPSRYVDRWKPQDDGGVLAKSRIGPRV